MINGGFPRGFRRMSAVHLMTEHTAVQYYNNIDYNSATFLVMEHISSGLVAGGVGHNAKLAKDKHHLRCRKVNNNVDLYSAGRLGDE